MSASAAVALPLLYVDTGWSPCSRSLADNRWCVFVAVEFGFFFSECYKTVLEFKQLSVTTSYLFEDTERLPVVHSATQPLYILCTQNRLLHQREGNRLNCDKCVSVSITEYGQLHTAVFSYTSYECCLSESVCISIDWSVDVSCSSSHIVRWSFLISDTLRMLLQAIFGHNDHPCLTVTAVLEPGLKISPSFSHHDNLSSGMAGNCTV